MAKRFLIVAANILEKKNKILLVQEKLKKVKGKWNFPAGRLEENESLIDCVKRETKEETGLKVKPSYLVGIYQYPRYNAIIFVFKSKILKGKLATGILKAKWYSINEIRNLNKKNRLVGSYVLEAIEDYKDRRKIPFKFIKVLK